MEERSLSLEKMIGWMRRLLIGRQRHRRVQLWVAANEDVHGLIVVVDVLDVLEVFFES